MPSCALPSVKVTVPVGVVTPVCDTTTLTVIALSVGEGFALEAMATAVSCLTEIATGVETEALALPSPA